MIRFEHVSVALSAGKLRSSILEDVSVVLPSDRKLILLGRHGAGKSTIIRLIAGLVVQDAGRIVRHARVSYPVGYAGGFTPHLSARRNILHAAELYGAEPAEVMSFVEAVAEIGAALDEPFKLLPQRYRIRLSYALSYALPFDVYLIDEMLEVGDQPFRRKCLAMFEERTRSSGVIFATRNSNLVRRYGDVAGVIQGRKIVLYDRPEQAIEDFDRLNDESSRTAGKEVNE